MSILLSYNIEGFAAYKTKKILRWEQLSTKIYLLDTSNGWIYMHRIHTLEHRMMGIRLLGYTQRDVSDWPKGWRVGLHNGEWIKAQQGTGRLEVEGPGE